MRKFIGIVAATFLAIPALAEPAVRWKTLDSLGCMMTRECKEGVVKLNSIEDLKTEIRHANYETVADETNGLITELDKMGVGVYLADSKYFPRGHAGVYYTVGNDFFLNRSWADDPIMMLQTLRHEAWHAAQDAMAGTIENSNIAIIRNEEDVPQSFRLLAEIAYPESVRPWEAEAKWAGSTPGMTLEVLRIINKTNNQPWLEIEPTPLTRLWLERHGYL